MSSPTFESFRPAVETLHAIYEIGSDADHLGGVIPDIADAFGYELTEVPSVDNLGGLISAVGPAKELQANIGKVQDILGTDEDAISIARGWVERSGLLTPVDRSYMTGEALDNQVSLAVITGGVRNWMTRRAERLEELARTQRVHRVLLLAGNRVMKPTEGPDVADGMTEADYMEEVVAPYLSEIHDNIEVVRANTGVGNEVMSVGATAIAERVPLDRPSYSRIAVASNAGAWVQNAGQLRRALRTVSPGFDTDGTQLFVVSDEFPLGNGTEPTATHQNPFTAVGQVVRNAQEYVKHVRQS